MKRNIKFIKFIISMILIFSLFIPITALGVELKAPSLPRVIDDDDLLTSEEEVLLSNKISKISKKYSMDIVLLTTNDYQGKTVVAFANDYFDYNNYGYGDPNNIKSGDGILLVINLKERDWYISTKGKSIKYFTDKRIQELGENIKPYLQSDNFYEAFDTYINNVEMYRNSNPNNMRIFISALICLGLAGIIVGIMAFSMNSARRKSSALDYVNSNSLQITYSRDIFTHSDTSRTKKANSSNSGGSSTHTSSSGSSHGGGGGKF